jgi:3-mercaptopyruvate sulfurtransferase SseA
MQTFLIPKTASSPPDFKRPTVDEMKPILEALGIGMDTNVVCYDLSDGMHACRAATILASLGVKNVKVLSGDSTTWGDAKNTTEIPKPLKANGTLFDFALVQDYWATDAEILEIADGKSSA